MLDPLSVIVGVPVLGPFVAYLLKDQRDARREFLTELAKQDALHTQALERQRDMHRGQVEALQVAYQELAAKVQDNFSRVVSENTAATRGLEKAVDTLVRHHERNPQV